MLGKKWRYFEEGEKGEMMRRRRTLGLQRSPHLPLTIRPGFTVMITAGSAKTRANGFLFPMVRLRKACHYFLSFVEVRWSYPPLVLLESWRRRKRGGSTFGWGRRSMIGIFS